MGNRTDKLVTDFLPQNTISTSRLEKIGSPPTVKDYNQEAAPKPFLAPALIQSLSKQNSHPRDRNFYQTSSHENNYKVINKYMPANRTLRNNKNPAMTSMKSSQAERSLNTYLSKYYSKILNEH